MKHCTLLRKTSLSTALKVVSQAKTVSLLYPEYELVWGPVQTDELLLLDTGINPIQLSGGDFSWVRDIPKVYCLPGSEKTLTKLIGREVVEL